MVNHSIYRAKFKVPPGAREFSPAALFASLVIRNLAAGEDSRAPGDPTPFPLCGLDWGLLRFLRMGRGFYSKLRKLYTTAYEFVTEKGIETHEEAQASRGQRIAHFWLLVIKSFGRNRCPLRATALAYTTLLALIPLLAVSFGLVSGFLREKGPYETKKIIGQLVDAVVPQLQLLDEKRIGTLEQNAIAPTDSKAPNVTTAAPPDPALLEAGRTNSVAGTNVVAAAERKLTPREEAINRIDELIIGANSKTLGFTGFVGLVFVAILLLSTIEGTFNDIWGVTRGRTWFRRVLQYWAMITLGPIAMFSVIYLVSTEYFKSGQEAMETLPFIGQWVIKALPFLVKSLAFVLVSLLFAVLYMMMPNTEVNWRAALMGGFVGGTLWLLLNIANAMNVSRVMNMSKIYGTALGIIPIFLIGLYFSWLIMLFGAQVAYAFQNREVYLQEKKAESVNQRNREYVALRVITLIAQRFDQALKPPTVLEIATELSIPSRLAGRVLQPMVDAGLVLEATTGKNEITYAPARPMENITCYDVLQTLRVGGGQELETRDEQARPVVCAHFERISDAERQAASTVTLKDLVNQISSVGIPEERRAVNWRPV
jgi:membrane protein